MPTDANCGPPEPGFTEGRTSSWAQRSSASGAFATQPHLWNCQKTTRSMPLAVSRRIGSKAVSLRPAQQQGIGQIVLGQSLSREHSAPCVAARRGPDVSVQLGCLAVIAVLAVAGCSAPAEPADTPTTALKGMNEVAAVGTDLDATTGDGVGVELEAGGLGSVTDPDETEVSSSIIDCSTCISILSQEYEPICAIFGCDEENDGSCHASFAPTGTICADGFGLCKYGKCMKKR